jgi:Ni/Fe-hydrogenase subunit HybB-like protein
VTTAVSSGPAQLTDRLLAPAWTPSRVWWVLFGVSGAGTLVLAGAVAYTVATGIGVWGNNIPVAWAYAIINFVWWIGIGHAGTFISAFLLLFHQRWRSSINRVAEAMTLFALINAGLFPLLHLGRPWFFYWLLPYPTRMGVWPQFKSALPWDAAAVATYFTVSLLFWYLGLVPAGSIRTTIGRSTGGPWGGTTRIRALPASRVASTRTMELSPGRV